MNATPAPPAGSIVSIHSRASSAASDAVGVVLREAPGQCLVELPDGPVLCTLAGRLLRHAGDDDVVAVGDHVRVARSGPGGHVIEVLPRRSAFARRAAGPRPRRQVLAANLDQVLAVLACAQPAPRWGVLDRLLVEAELASLPAVVCLTKADLRAGDELDGTIDLYRRLGYPVVLTSALTGAGVDALRSALADRTSVLVGPSGTGKTSLLNALEPGLGERVGEVSRKSGKGRHTTTGAALFRLATGGAVVDTAGVREFGLWDAGPARLAAAFREFQPLLGQCRFGSCTHVHEPGCAVMAAVRAGTVFGQRYRSYLRILGAEAAEGTLSHDADTQRQAARAAQPVDFRCAHCGVTVSAAAVGSRHRNHCPRCLHSMHVDQQPGDRAAACGGVMDPIAVWVRTGAEWAIIHRCRDCGTLHSNRLAGDDNELALVHLAVQPLARLPFPAEHLGGARAGG